MKRTLLLLACVPCFYLARAQSAVPQVISAGGAYYSAGGYSLSLTLGEMAAIETYTGSIAVLTQGFQQPDITGVGIAPLSGVAGDLSSFPNPANDQLHIAFTAAERGELGIRVYDACGREALLPFFASVEPGPVLQQLDLSAAAPGLYTVVVTFQPGSGLLSRSVQTISIVH